MKLLFMRPGNGRHLLILSVICLIVLITSLLLFQKLVEVTGHFVIRGTERIVAREIAPDTVNPGGLVNVTLTITVIYGEPSDRFYAIDEIIPDGWTIADKGDFDDSESGHLKAVVVENAQDRNYTYTVEAPLAEDMYTFSGTYQIEGMSTSAATIGDTEVTVQKPWLEEEICNNLDDTGDEQIDEGCDDDDDDYCDAGMEIAVGPTITVCPNTNTTSLGTIEITDDCDDDNGLINPGATEIECNDIDEDCDGIDSCDEPFKIYSTYYDGRTTDFATTNASMPFRMVLEKTDMGIVEFKPLIIFDREKGILLIDLLTNISHNIVRVDSNTVPELNVSANITLFNLTFISKTPGILRNGEICPQDTCTFIEYAGGNLIFSVECFSAYSAEEGPYCGDGNADPDELCDGSDLKGKTCQSFGYDTGTAACTASCTYDLSGCSKKNGGSTSHSPIYGAAECSEGETQSCGSSTGRCKVGYQLCENGEWSECIDEIKPIREICNGIDDDCNGEIDDGISCECLLGESRECGLATGVCMPGYRMCIDGEWSAECINDTGPTDEICDNGLDDDCDGDTDEHECILATSITCADGPITDKCVCGGKVYTEGYCYNDRHSYEDPRPQFPWEVASYIGGLIITTLLIILVIKEVKKFRRIQRQIGPEEQQKVKIKPSKEKEVHWVTDIVSDPRKFLDRKIKMGGYIRLSHKVSDKEFWYSFYDQSSTIALRSKKPLKEGYAEIKVVVKATPLDYVYVEPK